MTEEAHKALPHSQEAEQAVLGALMFDNAALERLPETLKAEHFYEGFHGRLYAAIEDHVRRGLMAEPKILTERFKRDEGFATLGGLHYLIDMVDTAPPAANARDYAVTVMDLALRRDLIRIGGDIASGADDRSATALQHLQTAEAGLFELAEHGGDGKGVVSFSDALRGAMLMNEAAYKRDGKLVGLSTGLIDLDRKLGGLHPSDLLIIAGRPSMGKTALATNIAFNIARHFREGTDEHGEVKTVEGGRVMFFSLEMSAEQLGNRILAEVSGVPSDRMRKGEFSADEMRRLFEAEEGIRHAPLRIDATGGLPITRLCARARREHRRNGLDLIVVDYLQLITTDGAKAGGRVQEVSVITSALKALAKELNVPIIALSQLSRQVESREDKRPMLSDLRESGSIEQDADCVMFVFRDAYYIGRSEPKQGTAKHEEWQQEMALAHGVAEVIVGKQRHGPIGTVKLSFDEDTTRFGNLARERDLAAVSPRYSYGGGQ